MTSIAGEYSFKSLAVFFSSPELPIEARLNGSISLFQDSTEMGFFLSPRNNFFESKEVNQKEFSSIDFDLVDRTLQRHGVFSVIEFDFGRYFIFSNLEENSSRNDLISFALQAICSFLESEFGPSIYYHFRSTDLVFDEELKLLDSINAFVMSKGKTKNDVMEAARFFPIEDDSIPNEILTAGPSISPLELTYVSQAVKHGWNVNHSTYLNKFEKEFANFVGSEFALATSSCTGALHLSLLALGIGPGDEVIVPDITWVATASAVRYVGAKPIFVDVNPETWTIDPNRLEEVINLNTKAIIPVHLYGFGAPMLEILQIANKHGLSVIEDAAPAIGTVIGGRLAGSFGDFGCFSFQGAKLLVTGEGGMLVTNDSELFARAKKIQDHGRKPGTFWIEELGYKYKMNNTTAALGLAQLQRAKMQIAKKREINSWYLEGLSDLESLHFQTQAPETESICWMTSFTIDTAAKIDRDGLMRELKSLGIDTRPVFPSISQYEIWGYSPTIPKFSKVIGDTGINIPSGVRLNKSSVRKVIDSIHKIMD